MGYTASPGPIITANSTGEQIPRRQVDGERAGGLDHTRGRLQGRYLVDRAIPAHPWLSTRRWVAKTLVEWGTEAFVWLENNRRDPKALLAG